MTNPAGALTCPGAAPLHVSEERRRLQTEPVMAGQRPEWTSLLFWRRHGGHLSDEVPRNDLTLDFVSSLTHLADPGVSHHAFEGVAVSPAPRMVF